MESNDGYAVSHSRTEVSNVLGETVTVTDEAGTLTYKYNATGNLTKVTTAWQDGSGNSIIDTVFDDLGRKTSMHDPDKGNWIYRYNALGELIEQTSAKDDSTQFFRDNLGRTVKREVNNGNEMTLYQYNQHRLASEGFSGTVAGSKTYRYDLFGRITHITKNLDNGQQYTSQTTYDQYGRVFQQFDPQVGQQGCINDSGEFVGSCWGIRHHYNEYGYASMQEEARYSGSDDDQVRKPYLTVNAMDAMGNVTQSTQGNGVVTNKVYAPDSGHIQSIAATKSGTIFQHNGYVFDGIGNLRERHRNSLADSYWYKDEEFDYDALDRLETVRRTGIQNQNIALTYSDNGNILSKSNMQGGATYHYGQQASQCSVDAGPHAVTQVGELSYCYDANGNQTHTYEQGNVARKIDYAHFDKPTRINAGGATTEFDYDIGRKRYKRVTSDGGIATTTYYVGNVEVVSKSNSTVVEIKRYLPSVIDTHYLDAGVDTGNAQLRYLHKDHLGSIDSISDENGHLVDKLYFDAWGKRASIGFEDWGSAAQSIAADENYLGSGLLLSNRGFTGHEHVDHADIIHMNGRIYDPTLGRFLQADPHIQAPGNSQSYNRYSYVLNNPLSMTDPSGYFFSKLWKKIKPFIGIIVAIVGTYICGPQCGQLGYALIGAASGATNAAVNGGNIFTGALIGAFSAAAFYNVGQYFKGLAATNSANAVTHSFGGLDLTSGQIAGQIASHAAVGGVTSVLSGGKFGHGFFSAGVTKGLGGAYLPGGSDLSSGEITQGTVVSMVIGGTVSVISGGKFINGANTAAFQYLFNQVSKAFYSKNPKLSFFQRASNNWNPSYLADFKSQYPYEYKLFYEFGSQIETENWSSYTGWDDKVVEEFGTFAFNKASNYHENYLNWTYVVDMAAGFVELPLKIVLPWTYYNGNETISALENHPEAIQIAINHGPQYLVND